MHFRQLEFTYSACGTFTKNKERIQTFKKTGDAQYIYQNELDKACFQHDIAYGDFKDLTRRTTSDKTQPDKAFNIAKNPKYAGYQCGLASIVYKFFDKKSFADKSASGSGIKNQNISDKELAQELHKPIIRKFNKRNVQSPFIENTWGDDLAYIQLTSKFNRGFRFLLCVIDIYSKYTWVIPLKDKKDTTITNAFQKFLKESNRSEAKSKGRKPNKIWLDKDSKFCNRSMKSWLEK